MPWQAQGRRSTFFTGNDGAKNATQKVQKRKTQKKKANRAPRCGFAWHACLTGACNLNPSNGEELIGRGGTSQSHHSGKDVAPTHVIERLWRTRFASNSVLVHLHPTTSIKF